MSFVPVFAKLPMSASTSCEIASAAVRAGRTGSRSAVRRPRCRCDARDSRPASAAVTGWLSGPAIKPLMLRAVFEVARARPRVPLVAVGGIRSGDDAIEAMLAGAWAVQVGTAALIDPTRRSPSRRASSGT